MNRSLCNNCGKPKEDNEYYNPRCTPCQTAVDEARQNAANAESRDEWQAKKEQALEARRVPLGMAAKKRPDSHFSRIDTTDYEERINEAR
jgi:hypothetical protein